MATKQTTLNLTILRIERAEDCRESCPLVGKEPLSDYLQRSVGTQPYRNHEIADESPY